MNINDPHNFDKEFQKLFTEMIEIAYEYVGNAKEVDQVCVYVSIENKAYFYNVFYRIGGSLTKAHKVNEYLSVDSGTPQRNRQLLKHGVDLARVAGQLFSDYKRDVPTTMKMIYEPKTSSFSNDIGYELQHSNHPDRTEVDGFNEWFEAIKMI